MKPYFLPTLHPPNEAKQIHEYHWKNKNAMSKATHPNHPFKGVEKNKAFSIDANVLNKVFIYCISFRFGRLSQICLHFIALHKFHTLFLAPHSKSISYLIHLLSANATTVGMLYFICDILPPIQRFWYWMLIIIKGNNYR